MLTRSRLLSCMTLAVAFALITASSALAKPSGSGSDPAQNLANELTHWAELVVIPIAALVALPALARRDVGQAFVVLIILVIVGAFAFDGPGVQRFVVTIANSVLGQ
jgi:hypothetical protein